MKTRSILLGVILVAAVAPAFAQSPSGMQGMQMDRGMPGMHKNKAAQGTGVIQCVFRSMPAPISSGCRPPIPDDAGPHSTGCRPGVGEAG